MTALAERGLVVSSLRSALKHGGHTLADVPALVVRILEEESWREFEPRPGRPPHRPKSFQQFVVEVPPEGLGADVDLVKRLIADDTQGLNLFDTALQEAHPHGGDRRSEEFKMTIRHLETERKPPVGEQRDLRRLRKDAPELHAEVLAGRLTAHRAMVQAGFRKKTVSIRVDDPESHVRGAPAAPDARGACSAPGAARRLASRSTDDGRGRRCRCSRPRSPLSRRA